MIWGSLTLGLCNIRGGGCVGWARVQLSAPALEDFPWVFSLRASPTSTLTILGNKSEHIDLWVIGKTTAKWGILATCLLTLFMSRTLLFYSTSSIWPTYSWAFTIFFFYDDLEPHWLSFSDSPKVTYLAVWDLSSLSAQALLALNFPLLACLWYKINLDKSYFQTSADFHCTQWSSSSLLLIFCLLVNFPVLLLSENHGSCGLWSEMVLGTTSAIHWVSLVI